METIHPALPRFYRRMGTAAADIPWVRWNEGAVRHIPTSLASQAWVIDDLVIVDFLDMEIPRKHSAERFKRSFTRRSSLANGPSTIARDSRNLAVTKVPKQSLPSKLDK